MGKAKVKNNNISGFRIAVMIISILLLSFIMAFSMLLGISSFKRNAPVVIGEDATTIRKALPAEGTLPTDSAPLDNIGYMAYVLDHQPFYHAYAYNSTKSTGYEQVTQSWKDYKSAELSGADLSVMVASDLSYSALVKSSSQSCFIGDNEAHIRSGNKPGKNSAPSDIEWSKSAPSVYDKQGYKYVYGEFSTEISVYVINEQTFMSADDVIDNGDGTYTQKYYLNENAACWYQYGMKTRGGLKTFPKFKRIEITFTFDSKWQILESYCEERATINPRALGGMDMESNSKTTTTFDYTAEGFDNVHFAYFEDYFKKYQGSTPGAVDTPKEEAGVLDILGSGFSKVVGGGQQFKVGLTLGETEYEGKIFLSLPDMSDILNTLDVRVALGRKDSGNQDLYIEFKNGTINVYYSTDFALTCNIGEISESVGRIAEWVSSITNPIALSDLEAQEESSGIDITSLINDLKCEIKDSEAFISLQSENLLGLGIGVDVVLTFDRIQEEDGDTFSAKSVDLNCIKYNGTTVDLKVNIVPDDGEIIERQPAQNPANLADYADSVYNLLNSNTVKVNINLTDKLIEGLNLDAVSYIRIGGGIAADAEISAEYKGITLKLDARYVFENAGYGKIYLHVSEINGKEVDAKVYCNIGDTVDTVKNIIELFTGNNGGEDNSPSESADLAKIINKVLNLDFLKIIGKVSGDNNSISLDINVDELLTGLDVSLGINFGTLTLALDREPALLSGKLPELGLGVEISGAENVLPEIDENGYVDINAYLESVYSLLNKPSYDISVSLAGTRISDSLDLSGLTVNGVATVSVENGTIRAALPVTAQYGDYGVAFTAYYTINLSDGSYGKIYLNVTRINGNEVNAKVYCDIKEVADSVKELISKFSSANTVSAESEEVSLLARAVETLLRLDYNEIISATNEKLSIKLNVDEILSGLDISLGGIVFGELNLEFTVADGSLSGTLKDLGLSVGVNGNEQPLADFATDGYVNLSTYLDSISALVSKNSYNLELSFVGNSYISSDIDLTGLALDVSAQIAFADGFSGVYVNISRLCVEYREASIELSAHYEVNFDGSYGTVYLNVTKVNGADVSAKVMLDITQAVDGVKNIINAFKAPSVQAYGATDIVADVINGILKLDFNELLCATNEKAEIKLDLDALLSELNLGLNLGTVNLEYVPSRFELTGSDVAIGLNSIKFGGSDEKIGVFDAVGYINLNAFISGIEELVNSNVYEIALKFTGSEIKGIDLSGLYLDATAYVLLENGFNNVTVEIPMLISYCGLEAELNVFYTVDIGGSGYGTVYICLTRIDRTDLNAKFYCNVNDAVSAVREIISSFSQPSATAQSEGVDIISKVVGIVLNLDYPEMIKGTKDCLSLTVDVDEILSELEISLGGVSFGELHLDLSIDGNCAQLDGKLEKLGVAMSIKGNGSYEINVPDESEYLDLTAVIKLVNDMIGEGRKIAAAKDVAFTANGTATVGGVQVVINGVGEVVWGDTVKVAVSLSLTVGEETLDINFVYSKDENPFIILTVNGAGVRIYNEETDKLITSFKGLIDAFADGGTSDGADEISAYAIEVGGYSLEEILKNGNVKTVLNAVLGFINDFTVEINGSDDIYSLLITRVNGATVTLGADGCLSLDFSKSDNKLFAKVEAGNGATVNDIIDTLNAEDEFEYFELSEFIRKLYDGFFDRVENLSLKNILGDNPYAVTLNISGANSGIGALEGVTVNAELYYDEGVVGTKFETKLMHVSLDMNINGTPVTATASYHGRTLFIELVKIGSTTLTGVKFKADVMNIFDAAEELVRLITDTNLVETLSSFTGKGNVTSSEIENLALFATQSENGTSAAYALTKLIDALLTLDLEQSFKFDKQTDTAQINVDAISEALLNVKVGTVTASFNGAENKLNAEVKLADRNAWFTLIASPCNQRTEVIDPDDYMNIGFVSTLLSDLAGTVTNNLKEIYKLYTFTGSININIQNIPVLGNINLEFKNATLTAGFDENNKFYITLGASMQAKSIAWYTVTKNMDISITYCDGLIVLGREIGTGNEKYKVLTLEYLLDNLLDKDNSPVRWLLGTSDDAWSLIANNVNLNVDSGLTKPKTYTLYEQLQQNVKEGKFDLSDYLSGMFVKADGNELTSYGNGASLAVSKFKLSDNFYAFDVNAGELTGGTLSALCAAVLRDENGLNGIKAYGEVGTMVNFTVDFGTYLEGVTEVYGGKVLKEVSVSEIDFFNDYKEVTLTADEFVADKYYIYDADVNSYDLAHDYGENDIYFEKVNSIYYLKSDDGKITLATVYDPDAVYFAYFDADGTQMLGTVAMRNYLAYVTDKYSFDRNKQFVNDTAHIDKIFGCYNSENDTYLSSDVLETIYLDVYASADAAAPERTLEVLYGSTVKLISDFPEFADEEKTQKLIYVLADGTVLPNEIVIADGEIAQIVDGRVSIYKHSEDAVKVTFNFHGIDGMSTVTSAFKVGDELKEYPLHDVTFLGWYLDEAFTIPVTHVEEAHGSHLTVHGMYVVSHYEIEGVVYEFDASEDVRGYFVSGVTKGIDKYYANAGLWLEIQSYIDGYPVRYIANGAFANSNDDAEHSLVNVLVPATVEAVYDNAFLDNKGLRQVVFLADKVFLGGRADSNSNKTSVFYGCYADGDIINYVHNKFTVYLNGVKDNPFNVATNNNAVDGEWNRIYYKNGWGKTVYYVNAVNSGWAFAQFDIKVVNLDGSSTFNADLSDIIYDGVHFAGYSDANVLANKISDMLIATVGNIYYVDVSGALTIDGGKHTITVTLTEHEEIKPLSSVTVTVIGSDGKVLLSNAQISVSDYEEFSATYDGVVSFAGKDDYALAGIYTDKEFTKLAPNTNDGTADTLYIKVVLKYVEAENGVKYEFVTATQSEPAHYAVIGFDAVKGAKFTQNDAWLIVANSLNGYSVTEVKANSFNNTKIKNIVLPENVVKIGTLAFGNNVDMLTAVFLANQVVFEGSSSNNNYPFYGSYTSANKEKTLLSVYYTEIVSSSGETTNYENNPYWAHFYSYSSTKLRYIGNDGGYRYNSGWVFTQFVVDNDGLEDYTYLKDLKVLNDGINVSFTEEYVVSQALEKINEATMLNGTFCNCFKVEVSCEYGEKLTVVNIRLIEDIENGRFAVTLNTADATGGAHIEGLVDSVYADAGKLYVITPVDGFIITSVSGVDAQKVAESDSWSFTMPANVTEIIVQCEQKPFTEITLLSEVSFVWDNTVAYEVNVSAQAGDAMVGAPVAEKSSYIFVGWAYKASENSYVFEGDTVNYNVYYAVWAYKRDEISELSANDLTLTATVDSTMANSVYGWYNSADFSGNPAALCTENSATLSTVSSTTLYAKLYYTLTVSVSGTECRKVIIEATAKIDGAFVNEETVSDSASSDSSLYVDTDIKVLEGDIIRVQDLKDTDKDYCIQLKTENGYENITGQININTNQRSGLFSSVKASVMYPYDSSDNKIEDESDIAVKGNLTITFKN